jgi:DNA-directed RNA polymerase specialized sigma24 family protein
MPEPSHFPCPMCGTSEDDERIADVNELADQALNNLKFLNLGFTLCYLMTDLERSVYFHHQIRKDTFKEISKLLNKSEATLKMAWKRCKLRGDKALEDSML